MKKQLTTLAICAVIMCAGATTVYANDMCKPAPFPPEIQKVKPTPEQCQAKFQQKMDEFEAKLGLTQEQKVQAKQIRENSHTKIKPLIDKKLAKIKEIQEIRENDNIKIKVQDEKIEKIKHEIKTIDQEIRQVHQDARIEFKKILTEKQKTKLTQMKQECHKNRMHPKHHKMMKRPYKMQ